MPDFYVTPQMDGPIYLLGLTGQGLAQPEVEKRRFSNSGQGRPTSTPCCGAHYLLTVSHSDSV